MKIYKVGILGGGIAGLSCAYHLNKKGITDFVVVAKELGGRVRSSADGKVNYGTYYVRSDYKHILSFVHLKRKILNEDFLIITDKGSMTIKQVIRKNFWHLLKLLIPLIRFKAKFRKFRKESEFRSQKEIIESDSILSNLYLKTSKEYLKEKGLERMYPAAEAMARLHGFTTLNNAPAFLLLEFGLGVFYPIFELEFKLNELIAGLQKRIILDEAVSVKKDGDHWAIKSKSQEIFCEYLVSALPINISNDFFNLNLKTNGAISVHVFHITGSLKPQYQTTRYTVFSRGDEIGILGQADDSYLLYSFKEDVDLSKYFMNYQIIAKKHWDPALFIGSNLVELKQKENLFLIGDYNLPGLEDAFITGMCAANLIISSQL